LTKSYFRGISLSKLFDPMRKSAALFFVSLSIVWGGISKHVLAASCSDSTQVPLLKARLEQISTAQGTNPNQVEYAFEDFAIATYKTFSGQPLPKYRGATLPSLEREVATKGAYKGIVPDSISNLFYSRPSGVQVFNRSVFHEIKALQKSTLPPSTSKHQVTGYLDVMRRAPSAQAGVPPALVFLTTSDVKGVGRKTRLRATFRKIWLEHAIACEVPNSFDPTDPRVGSTIQLGPSLVQNPEVIFLTGVLYLPSGSGTPGKLPIRP
jgi:hypothetical protein